MRRALAALLIGGTVLTAAPAALALPCPPPTQSQPTRVGVVWVTICVLYVD